MFKDRDIRVIPNCLDTDVFCPESREGACRALGLNPENHHILFGAMQAVEDANKGFNYLIDALRQISSSLPEKTDLVVFGTNRTLPEDIGGIKVFRLGILRKQEDIVAAYRVADVTVVPSLSENLSCTIQESLSCGTPVAAFAIGGNSDLVDHMVNGYLAREKNSTELAAGILWCLEHIEFVSDATRKKVVDCYTPSVVGKQYAELYKSLIES